MNVLELFSSSLVVDDDQRRVCVDEQRDFLFSFEEICPGIISCLISCLTKVKDITTASLENDKDVTCVFSRWGIWREKQDMTRDTLWSQGSLFPPVFLLRKTLVMKGEAVPLTVTKQCSFHAVCVLFVQNQHLSGLFVENVEHPTGGRVSLSLSSLSLLFYSCLLLFSLFLIHCLRRFCIKKITLGVCVLSSSLLSFLFFLSSLCRRPLQVFVRM